MPRAASATTVSALPVRGGSSSAASNFPSRPPTSWAASPAASRSFAPAPLISSALRRRSCSAGPEDSTATTDCARARSGSVSVPLPLNSSMTRPFAAAPSAASAASCRAGIIERFACEKTSGRERSQKPGISSINTGSPKTSGPTTTPWTIPTNAAARRRSAGAVALRLRNSTAPVPAALVSRARSVTPGRSLPRNASASFCNADSRSRHSAIGTIPCSPTKPHEPRGPRCSSARRR